MKQVRLIALDQLPYGGQNFKKGAEFLASENDAKVLTYIGKAAKVKPAKKSSTPALATDANFSASGDGSAEGAAAETGEAASKTTSAPPRRRTSRNRAAAPTQTK